MQVVKGKKLCAAHEVTQMLSTMQLLHTEYHLMFYNIQLSTCFK